MNYYLKLATNNTDLIDPMKPLPGAEGLIPIVQKKYQRFGVGLLGANRDMFMDLPRNQRSVRQATVETQETRIFIDNTALVISPTILGFGLAGLHPLVCPAAKNIAPQDGIHDWIYHCIPCGKSRCQVVQ